MGHRFDRTLRLVASGLCGFWLSLGGQVTRAPALTITPADPVIAVGQTQQFTASDAITPTAVSAGGQYTCVLLRDGTVQCWGRNVDGQLGDGTTANPSTGPPGSSVPVAVSGIRSADAITAGAYHTCALLADGTVQCWGRNHQGQLGDGTTT